MNMLKFISNSLKEPVDCQPFKLLLVASVVVVVHVVATYFKRTGKGNWLLSFVCHVWGESTWDYYEGKHRIVQVKYK